MKEIVEKKEWKKKKVRKKERRKDKEFKDKIVLTMVGRLSGEKRQDVLIDAVSKSKYADKIQLIFAGKGIEMNMAGFKYGLQKPHPHPDIIKRYKELGGEIITVGADGHAPEQIAYNYKDAKKILKECGFEYYTIFKGRKPIFTKIA